MIRYGLIGSSGLLLLQDYGKSIWILFFNVEQRVYLYENPKNGFYKKMEKLNFICNLKCPASKMHQAFLCGKFNCMNFSIGFSFDLSSKDFIN